MLKMKIIINKMICFAANRIITNAINGSLLLPENKQFVISCNLTDEDSNKNQNDHQFDWYVIIVFDSMKCF